jgi:hypothetical protein
LISDVSAGGAVQVRRSADLDLASVVFAEIKTTTTFEERAECNDNLFRVVSTRSVVLILALEIRQQLQVWSCREFVV